MSIDIKNFLVGAQLRSTSGYEYGSGIFKGREREIFSVTHLIDLLSNPLLSPPWLKVIKGGQDVPLDKGHLWKTVQGRQLTFLDKTALNEALATGGSLVLEGLDILDPKINSLLTIIDGTMPCALSNCEAFFSRRGNEAYGGHRDSDDVLVLQISGTKLWRIHEAQIRRHFGNAPLTDEEMGPVLTTLELKPGDALFLRAGVPHKVTTVHDHSLHLSIDLIDRSPNIEQITNAGNQLFNTQLEPSHSPPGRVINAYVGLLQSPEFLSELDGYREKIAVDAKWFRKRIEGAHKKVCLNLDN